MDKKHYCAFISYASEDKELVARPIAVRLFSMRLNIWFDEFEIKPGDSLSRKIAEGLNKSSYGICIFSPSFFKKSWPKRELQGLIALLIENETRILPVWYKISKKEIMHYDPALADIVRIKTDGKNISNVCIELVKTLSPKKHQSILRFLALVHAVKYKKKTRMSKVPLTSLKNGPIQHEQLPESAISRSALISKMFEEVGENFFTFMDSLQRDLHFNKELLIWEFMATLYLDVNRKNKLNLNQKKELYFYLISLSIGEGFSEGIETQFTSGLSEGQPVRDLVR